MCRYVVTVLLPCCAIVTYHAEVLSYSTAAMVLHSNHMVVAQELSRSSCGAALEVCSPGALEPLHVVFSHEWCTCCCVATCAGCRTAVWHRPIFVEKKKKSAVGHDVYHGELLDRFPDKCMNVFVGAAAAAAVWCQYSTSAAAAIQLIMGGGATCGNPEGYGGAALTAVLAAGATGTSGKWDTLTIPRVSIPEGSHRLKICVSGGLGINIDSLTFTLVSGPWPLAAVGCWHALPTIEWDIFRVGRDLPGGRSRRWWCLLARDIALIARVVKGVGYRVIIACKMRYVSS